MKPPGVDDPLLDPLAALEAEHSRHAKLCDLLETIADALPSSFNPDHCRRAVYSLRIELPRHHADEEYGLFPLLRKVAGETAVARALLRLEEDHHGDEAHSDELIPFLEQMATGEPPANPEMIGYMLRGFFEAYRRHIAWENSIVLPLARAHLDDSALGELRQIMAANRAAVAGIAGEQVHHTETVRSLLWGLCGKADPDITSEDDF